MINPNAQLPSETVTRSASFNETESNRSSQPITPRSPALLVVAAWIAGTLLFEIASIDDVGSPTLTSQWSSSATPVDEPVQVRGWTSNETHEHSLRSTSSDSQRLDRSTASEPGHENDHDRFTLPGSGSTTAALTAAIMLSTSRTETP